MNGNSTRRRTLGGLVVALAALAVALAPGAGAGNGADGSTYVLTSFDGTSLLLGLNDQGRTLLGQYDSTTSFKAAKLDKYSPTDPYRCGDAAAAYNDALIVSTSDGGVFKSALSGLAVSQHCKARVVFSPQDPYVPPNPIRIQSFQPVP